MSGGSIAGCVTLTALLAAAECLRGTRWPPAPHAAMSPWLGFALLATLGIASLVFGLLNPELVAASFYEG
jgi:hypothetical protein